MRHCRNCPHAAQRAHQQSTKFGTGRTSSDDDKRQHARLSQRAQFNSSVPNVLVLRQHDPAVAASFGEPDLVGFIGIEMLVMSDDHCACSSQRRGNGDPPQ